MMEKLAGDFERLELNGSTVIPIHIGSHIHILKRAQTHLSLSRDVSVFTGPTLRTSFFSSHFKSIQFRLFSLVLLLSPK